MKPLKDLESQVCIKLLSIVRQPLNFTQVFVISIVTSFTEVAPKLLSLPGAEYLLSEVFSQDPLERYFAKQRHRGGSNDNPTAAQVPYNASTLMQQRSVYKDICTMAVESENSPLDRVSEPLQKRPRKSNQIPLSSVADINIL